MSALSERKPFAIDSGGSRAPVDIRFCLDMLKQLKELKDGNKVDSFMPVSYTHLEKWSIVLLTIFLTITPIYFGKGIQTYSD